MHEALGKPVALFCVYSPSLQRVSVSDADLQLQGRATDTARREKGLQTPQLEQLEPKFRHVFLKADPILSWAASADPVELLTVGTTCGVFSLLQLEIAGTSENWG